VSDIEITDELSRVLTATAERMRCIVVEPALRELAQLESNLEQKIAALPVSSSNELEREDALLMRDGLTGELEELRMLAKQLACEPADLLALLPRASTK